MAKGIVNRKAKFEYQFVYTYEAGIQLLGPEVKSIRAGNANMTDAYCYFRGGELYIKNLFIAEYKMAHVVGLETRRERKLLLKRAELRKMERRAKEKGFTIVPYKIYFNERGIIKIQIALAQGKKVYDKRQSIKEKDNKRDLERIKRGKYL